MPWFQQPFFQVALPIILTLVVAMWREDKRFNEFKESVNTRLTELKESTVANFAEVKAELKEIKDLLRNHDRDIVTLKERTGLVQAK